MKETLRITLVQTDLHWMSPEANRHHIEELLWDAMPETDLVLLPETFTTGFHPDASTLAEPMRLTTFKWMQQMAQQLQASVAGSYPIKENGKIHNRLLWMNPDGSFDYYDKRHLFSMGAEGNTFTAGNERLIVDFHGWKLCPMICYDLRFPVWSRNQGLAYDALIYVANWPNPRITIWDTLLQARAIENSCYTVGLNRCGSDPHLSYDGHSAVYGPKGDTLLKMDDQVALTTATLSKKDLLDYREAFPVHLDADDFNAQVS
ncbi:amidohydrolase [Algivirga pacifica]|uniref:Amidohydrolase n=1 Tax=Algivirga pacifica TaxID=1162670 RepID=A0ABP9DE47_9BACT